MKKLVAISVLVAGLAAAAFAQDEGKWKFGFSASFATDMLYVTSASGKSTTTPAGGSATTNEFGSKNKGTIIWFDNAKYDDAFSPLNAGANRLLLSISNSGENYEVYADIAMDNWTKLWGNNNQWFNEGINPDNATEDWASGGGVLGFLTRSSADWHLKGSAGIFDAQIGTNWFNTGGWVSPQPVYSGFGNGDLSRFGVKRLGGAGDWWSNNRWIAADTFRTWPEWGSSVTVGIHLGDNYKFTLGYNLNPGYADYPDQVYSTTTGTYSFADAWKSKSSINGTFLLSGKPVDALTFDLFYSIIGSDNDTFARKANAAGGYDVGDGLWHNTAGVYIGIDAIEKLGLSLGYTANFNVFETGTWLDTADLSDPTKAKPVTYNAPIYSGIDVRLSYSGIENIGLIFNNNISLAGVKGEKVDGYKDKLTLMFNESTFNAEGKIQDWFYWNTQLKVSFGFIEGVDLALFLENQVGVQTDESTTGTVYKTTNTDNKFRAALSADYGVGAMKLGIGIVFDLESSKVESTYSGAGSFTGEYSVLKFGIPIKVSVAF